MTTVTPVSAFSDNYIWLIQKFNDANVAIVDPGEAEPVFRYLHENQLNPVAILITHHHWDHVDGVRQLVARHPIPVYGPATEAIPCRTRALRGEDRIRIPELALEFSVLDVPGHTSGAISYVGEKMLYCGDTLFAAGCGRLFEGTPGQMHASLSILASLPDDTRVFCGHEYTLANLEFARNVEPGNTDITRRINEMTGLRERNLPTLPSVIGEERKTNPFLRCHLDSVRESAEKQAGRQLASTVEVFATVRAWKDRF